MNLGGARTPPLLGGSASAAAASAAAAAAAAAKQPAGKTRGNIPSPPADSLSLQERWPLANSADIEGQASKFLRWADSGWPAAACQTASNTASIAASTNTSTTAAASPLAAASLLPTAATMQTDDQAGQGFSGDDPLAVALAQEVGGICRVPSTTMDRLRAEFDSRELELEALRRQLRAQQGARSEFEKKRLLLRQLEDSCVVAENEIVLWRQEVEHSEADAEALQRKKAALQVQADEARLEADHLESWVQAARSLLLPSKQASGRVVQQYPHQQGNVFQQQQQHQHFQQHIQQPQQQPQQQQQRRF